MLACSLNALSFTALIARRVLQPVLLLGPVALRGDRVGRRTVRTHRSGSDPDCIAKPGPEPVRHVWCVHSIYLDRRTQVWGGASHTWGPIPHASPECGDCPPMRAMRVSGSLESPDSDLARAIPETPGSSRVFGVIHRRDPWNRLRDPAPDRRSETSDPPILGLSTGPCPGSLGTKGLEAWVSRG